MRYRWGGNGIDVVLADASLGEDLGNDADADHFVEQTLGYGLDQTDLLRGQGNEDLVDGILTHEGLEITDLAQHPLSIDLLTNLIPVVDEADDDESEPRIVAYFLEDVATVAPRTYQDDVTQVVPALADGAEEGADPGA